MKPFVHTVWSEVLNVPAETAAYSLVRRRCGEGKRHLFFIAFRPILHVAFIHGAWRGWRRRWQWGEDSGPIGACRCGWNPGSWTLRSGRAASAAPCPWTCSLKKWVSTYCSATPCRGQRCSGDIPTREGICYTHVGKWVRRCIWILANGRCRSRSHLGDSRSARPGIVGERGRLRASTASHPCPRGDWARILTADLRSHHHIREMSRGEKVQKGTCPSPPFLQHSFSVWDRRKQHQKFL